MIQNKHGYIKLFLTALFCLVLSCSQVLAAEVNGNAAANGLHFTLETPPAEVLRNIPSLSSLANIVGGGWGKTWQEASIIVDDAPKSDMLTIRYVVATQNMLMALRASLDDYPSRSGGEAEVLVDYERIGREFYWGAQGQALERIRFKAYTVPASRLAEAQKIVENPGLSPEERHSRLSKLARTHDEIYWFDISAPFRHNSRILWR